MGAAFALGADVVELDVHPTTDGRFAVFHDWTLDCRTEGTGETRDHNMAYLKTLDIGYGYTVDGGRTFPLRGTGAGLMPSFSDVMAAFPGKKFLVNFKSNEAREGDTLADMLEANPEWRIRSGPSMAVTSRPTAPSSALPDWAASPLPASRLV
jgi:glycerophosphoryl diester phosphodiesterase